MQTRFSKGIFNLAVLLIIQLQISAQVNSPYSRIGLGNIFPTTFSASTGMGGISMAQFNITDIQFSNPASYSFLSKAVFEVGLNADYLNLKSA